ncbi:hypothetical protein QPX96_08580 [Limosilactobacillus fermentum]|nr:hypothetical protein [Limosilactobacillus fermentum]
MGDPSFCQLVEEASQATGLNIATLMKGEGANLITPSTFNQPW